jgi:hypothetical protein
MSLDSLNLTTPFDQAAFFVELKKSPCGLCTNFGQAGCSKGEEAKSQGANMPSLIGLLQEHQQANGGGNSCANTKELG